MKTIIKATLFLSVFVVSVLSLSSTGMVSALPALNNIPFHPGVSSLDDFLGKSAFVLDHVIPANISGTNVYYYNYNVTNTVTQNIKAGPTSSSKYFSLDPANSSALRIKSFCNNLDANLSAIYAALSTIDSPSNAIHSYLPSGTSGWGSLAVTAWKVTIIKEWYATEKVKHPSTDLTSTVNFQAYVDTIDANLTAKGLGAFGSFASMTPDMVMAVTWQIIKPVWSFQSLQWAYQAAKNVPDILSLTISSVVNWSNPIVNAATIELSGKNSLTLDYSVNIDLVETINVEDLGVIVIWDNDNSLMHVVSEVKAGRMPTSQPFSGDEVVYLLHFNTMIEHFVGSVLNTMNWYYDGSTSNKPTALGNFVRMMAVRPEIAASLGRAAGDDRLSLVRALVFGNITAPSVDKTFHQSSFGLSQLKVDKLQLSYSRDTGINAAQVNLWFEEHDWAGLVAFNDTNHDGIMNLAVNGTYPFLYPISNEARYRFDITGVSSRAFATPSVVNEGGVNGINFGITFSNVTGKLVPYDINQDTARFNKTITGALNETVPSMAFNFRFTANMSNHEGRMKVSYDFGQFNNGTGAAATQRDLQLQGLSLSMVSTLDVLHLLHSTRVFNASTLLSDENGGNVTMNGDRLIKKIRFGSGSSLQDSVFQADLASIPYTIDGTSGTTYTAYGQMIPVLVGGISYGHTTAVGNLTRQTKTAIVGGVFLYAVNFPTWNGQEIVHDPVFSTFISPTSNFPVTWIIVGVAIGGVAALVVIVMVMRARNKRSSSIPGSRGVTGEVRERPGANRIALLNSLFFHFDAGNKQEPQLQASIDPYDPAMFEFFAGLNTIIVNEMEPGIGSWSRLSWTSTDVEGPIGTRELASTLGSGLLLSEDKHDLPVNAGRAYLYRLEFPSGTMLYLLDIFTRSAVDAIYRISLCSKQPMASASMIKIEAALRRLSMALQQTTSGKFKPDLIEQLVPRYLPVQLAMPRHQTPAEIIEFSRQIRLDEQLVPADVAEIEADLKNMDDDMARRVVNSFKDESTRIETEPDEIDDESESKR